MTTDTICTHCKHLTPDLHEEGVYFCKAFPTPELRSEEDIAARQKTGIMVDPKGIPDKFILTEEPHLEPCCNQIGDFTYEEGE